MDIICISSHPHTEFTFQNPVDIPDGSKLIFGECQTCHTKIMVRITSEDSEQEEELEVESDAE